MTHGDTLSLLHAPLSGRKHAEYIHIPEKVELRLQSSCLSLVTAINTCTSQVHVMIFFIFCTFVCRYDCKFEHKGRQTLICILTLQISKRETLEILQANNQ